jgi:hypothetical protein
VHPNKLQTHWRLLREVWVQVVPTARLASPIMSHALAALASARNAAISMMRRNPGMKDSATARRMATLVSGRVFGMGSIAASFARCDSTACVIVGGRSAANRRR